jgi:adenylate cyclase 1
MSFCLQVAANAIIFTAVNIVGVYIHELTDKTSRKLFLDMRASIATRLCLEDENDKLERLLMCSLPPYLATEMKDSVRLRQSQGIFHKSYIQCQSSARFVDTLINN